MAKKKNKQNRKVLVEKIKLRKVWKTFTETFIYGKDVKWFCKGDFVTDGEGNFYYVTDTEWLDGGVLITHFNGIKIKENVLLHKFSFTTDHCNVYKKLRGFKREYNLKQLNII